MFLVLDFDRKNFECKYCCRLAAVDKFVEGLTLMNLERQDPLAVVVDRLVEETIELVEGPAVLVVFFLAGFWRSS